MMRYDSGFGRAVASQKDLLVMPAKWPPSNASSIPAVLVLHGRAGKCDTFLGTGAFDKIDMLVRRYGLPCILGDEDGSPANTGNAFGNDASLTNCLALLAWGQSVLGCRSDKALILGTSMGSGMAMLLHANNTSKFLAAAHLLVTTDWQGGYVSGDTTSDLDAAYSNVGGGWPTAEPTKNPKNLALNGLLTGLPMWFGDTTDDTKNGGQAGVDAFTAVVGGSAIDGPHYYGTGGHDISKISADAPTAYLAAHV